MSDYGSDNEEGDPYELVYPGEEDNEEKRKWVGPDGEATATFGNQDTYTGEYKDGKRHGKGVYTFFAASQGNEEDEEEGNPVSYDGDYSECKRNGVGTFKYPDKSVYLGEWVNNQRHGQGTYTYPNGDKYCGSWVGDKKQGPGTYIFAADMTQVTGVFQNDECTEGKWTYHDKNGLPFEAQLANQPSVSEERKTEALEAAAAAAKKGGKAAPAAKTAVVIKYTASDSQLPSRVQTLWNRGETHVRVRVEVSASAQQAWDVIGRFDDMDWVGPGLLTSVEGKARWINMEPAFQEVELYRDDGNFFYVHSNESVPNMTVRFQVHPTSDSTSVLEYWSTSSLPQEAVGRFKGIFENAFAAVAKVLA
jgi:radial spoke head protein 1